MEKFTEKIISSWLNKEGNVNSIEDILAWIQKLNKSTDVNIEESSIRNSTFWFYDDYNGEILNRKRSFFSIKGMRHFENGKFIGEQPIIVQPEIGYLGIICKLIDGELNFLMQAKIEPGNVNCVQISPTIQATKSNFLRVHGGNLPTYFELFENSANYDVIYDQVQSEQAARFYKKRNRNMIMIVDDDITVYPNFKWMTLGQIKCLLKIDNLVNMDTRTVLSGIPLIFADKDNSDLNSIKKSFRDDTLYNSIFNINPHVYLPQIFRRINNYKMFKEVAIATVSLEQLVDWSVDDYGIHCNKESDFEVCFYDISISGREVQQWSQPLFKAIGSATFGIITRNNNNVKEFLVRIRPEIGCFDKVELGPAIQWSPSHSIEDDNDIDRCFRRIIEVEDNIEVDVILSEEGGRFYHEQNRNLIVKDNGNCLCRLPDDYLWVSYSVLNYLTQTYNCLNIQLRNLLTLIDM